MPRKKAKKAKAKAKVKLASKASRPRRRKSSEGQYRKTFEPGQITTTEAAAKLGVSRRTIQRWIERGKDGKKLPCRLTAGGHARISEDEFRAWCEGRGIRYGRG